MKSFIYFFIAFCTLSSPTFAQSNFEWPIKELDTARNVSYLSEVEKDVILELNKVRFNPAVYAELSMKWMEVYYSGDLLKIPGKEVYKTNEGKAALLECIEELKKASPAPILKPSKGMTKACELLVYDQSSTGKTGHRGSGNSTPSDRAANFGQFMGNYAENIHYGDCEATFVVISLLIDDGVKSRGHRKNILDKSFNYTGVAIGDHKEYGQLCVNTFATAFTEK
ncbi:MAG: CAP domain-containing protein [Prolixibacteraceae bacterium]